MLKNKEERQRKKKSKYYELCKIQYLICKFLKNHNFSMIVNSVDITIFTMVQISLTHVRQLSQNQYYSL